MPNSIAVAGARLVHDVVGCGPVLFPVGTPTADDLHRILAEVTDEPAYVLGSSGGASGRGAACGVLPRRLPARGHAVGTGPRRTARDATARRRRAPHVDGELAHRTAVAPADALGTDLAHFPGDHRGVVAEPAAFAARLREVPAG